MIQIQEVTDVDMAFPASVKHLIPEEIPKEFKHHRSTVWNKLFSDWFFFGLKSLELTPKEGVDKDKALRHIKCIMGSFEPKHEVKESAVAYLLSEWFIDPIWEAAPVKNQL